MLGTFASADRYHRVRRLNRFPRERSHACSASTGRASAQYVNLDSGPVLFSDCPDCVHSVYRISLAEITSNAAGSLPAAHFDRYDRHPT